MRRRAYLQTVAAGAVAGTAGCAGGDVVHSTNKSVTVPRGTGWIQELPAEAGEIKFVAKEERPFDVYVFTDPDDVEPYRSYVDGESVDRKPAGDQSLGGRATRLSEDLYMASTADKGREELSGEGPAYFVLDHSDYRGETVPPERVEELSVTLELEAVASRLPI
jgi:hypothetical protein